jgi:NhaP-type Na+/H+ and K+/H+ antiporter
VRDDFEFLGLVGAGVLLAAILAVQVSTRAGLPSLLVYLGIGVVLGDSVIGVSSTTPTLPTYWPSPPWSSSWPRAV